MGGVSVGQGRAGRTKDDRGKTQCPPSQHSIETFLNRCNFQVINNFKQREPHFSEKYKTIFLSDQTTKIVFSYKNFYFGMTRIKVNLCRLEFCVPKLIWNETRQDETRRDWRAIPKLAGPVQDYFIMVPLLRKIWVYRCVLQSIRLYNICHPPCHIHNI